MKKPTKKREQKPLFPTTLYVQTGLNSEYFDRVGEVPVYEAYIDDDVEDGEIFATYRLVDVRKCKKTEQRTFSVVPNVAEKE